MPVMARPVSFGASLGALRIAGLRWIKATAAAHDLARRSPCTMGGNREDGLMKIKPRRPERAEDAPLINDRSTALEKECA